MSFRKFATILCVALCAFIAPLTATRAGSRLYKTAGEINGAVTDPKGARVVGATVALQCADSDAAPQTATTDAQGRYVFKNVEPGVYILIVTAKGFSEARREGVQISEAAVTIDFKLELAPIEAGSVSVTAKGAKSNADPVYVQLRAEAKAATNFDAMATVNNLVIERDAGKFILKSGEIYFLAPVEGRVTGAVFFGDGEFSLTPPTEIEKHSLAIFTDAPSINESFTALVLRFTDKTFDEIKSSKNATMTSVGAQVGKARDLFRDNQQIMRRTLHDNMELKTLADIYAPSRPGFFTAYIGGRKHNKLIYALDPQGLAEVSPEEVALISYGDNDGGIWTAFHLADEYKKGTAKSSEDRRRYDIMHHDLDVAIRGTNIAATDRVTLRPLISELRVAPFRLYRTLRVSRVRDEKGNDLSFIQEDKNEDADFGVILPQAPEVGKDLTLTIEYAGGDALRDAGGGNFFLIPRSTWYPNNAGTQFGDRATFDVTYHYPKSFTLVGTGALAAPETEADKIKTAKWTSGQTELAVAGFNYGRFKKKELLDERTKYNIEVYANEESSAAMRGAEEFGSMNTTSMAGNAIADAENSTRIYDAYFGKIPYARIAMTQQPAGNFGQSWPTLVYMPFTAFMDSTQRYLMSGGSARFAGDNFFQYVGPHEVAHQWWGHAVGWTSYHDQWMSEGFAEFSASLFVQFTLKDPKKFNEFWEDQRKLIVEASPFTKGRKPYTVGPVTQGYRLNNAKTGSVARAMVYPKGAYILHMLRMMMHTPKEGDRPFQAMMHDFIKSHYNKDISTEDFQRAVEKYMSKQMDIMGDHRMDWFFDEWVYGTEIPAYKFAYQINGNNLSASLTQSGVSDKFRMLVPIYVDFGKGWVRLGSATITGDSTLEIPNVQLPMSPKRAAICVMNDVLATNIEDVKK